MICEFMRGAAWAFKLIADENDRRRAAERQVLHYCACTGACTQAGYVGPCKPRPEKMCEHVYHPTSFDQNGKSGLVYTYRCIFCDHKVLVHGWNPDGTRAEMS